MNCSDNENFVIILRLSNILFKYDLHWLGNFFELYIKYAPKSKNELFIRDVNISDFVLSIGVIYKFCRNRQRISKNFEFEISSEFFLWLTFWYADC